MLDINTLSLYINTDKLNGYRSPKNLNLNRDSIGARFFISFLPCPTNLNNNNNEV
jgi:hypothetical protein